MDTNTYSKEELQMFKDAFLVVKGKALTCPELLSSGVCYNADEYLKSIGQKEAYDDTVYQAINVLATGWPHGKTLFNSSTLLAYFVPHTPGYGKWEGPNLEMRLDLMYYLIAKCDTLLAEQE